MLYNKNGVMVDQTRYQVEGETFPINTIASVSAHKKNISLVLLLILLVIGALGINLLINGATYGLIALLFSAIGLYFTLQSEYSVRITNAAGHADSYKSKNREEVIEIVNAINEAIIKRG